MRSNILRDFRSADVIVPFGNSAGKRGPMRLLCDRCAFALEFIFDRPDIGSRSLKRPPGRIRNS
jgi:hypothetical protein